MTFPDLSGETIAVDTETTGLVWKKDKVFGLAVAAGDQSWYFDVRKQPGALDWLRDTVQSARKVVNFNLKFDAHMLLNEGITIPDEKAECSSVRACLINEHGHDYGLDALAKAAGVPAKDDTIYQKLADLFGGPPTRAAQIRNLARAPVEVVAPYAMADAVSALRLWEWQEREIEKQGLHDIWRLEQALTPVLWRMERRGVRIDEHAARQGLGRLKDQLVGSQRTLVDLTGRATFNQGSPLQVREFFKPEQREGGWYIGDQRIPTTPVGAPSIDANVLRSLTHPLAAAILKHRKLEKTRQFLEGHVLGHAIDGSVYPDYNQTRGEEGGVRFGRLSIHDPALQQIPARDKDVGAVVRSCFLPEEGDEWVCADWSQFEFRWVAHFANSAPLNKAYAENPDADFHQMVADLTGLPRNAPYAGAPYAKGINLGLAFGMGQGRLAKEMGLPFTVERRHNKDVYIPGPETLDIFARYHSGVPGVQSLVDRAAAVARARGYIRTVGGRHLRFPRGHSTHKAGALLFQGSSADCLKQKLVELDRAGTEPRLSVHDEADFSIAPGDTAKREVIREILTTFDGEWCPIKCRIPITCDISSGINWWEASK